MRILLVLLIGGVAFLGNAQIIQNEDGEAFSDDPFFNTEYIFNNGIKKIEGQLWVKAEGDKMRRRPEKVIYNFNGNGYLTSRLEIKSKDTVAIFYKYNAKGQILSKSRSNRNGFTTDYFSYDLDGKLKKQSVFREKNKNNGFDAYIPYESNQMSSYTMKYETIENENKTIITVYNTSNKPFKRIQKTYDELGYLLEEYVHYFIGSGYEKTNYNYTQEGLLKEIKKEVKITTKKTYRQVYYYDEHQNIEKMEQYVDEKLKVVNEAVYDWEDYELKAFIENDKTLNFMKIFRLSIIKTD